MSKIPDQRATIALITRFQEGLAAKEILRTNPKDKQAMQTTVIGEKAADQLINGHYGLIITLGYKAIAGFSRRPDPDDICQWAVLGFLRAIGKFDTSRSTKLSSYVYPWIREALWSACRDDMGGMSGKWGNDLYWSIRRAVTANKSISEMTPEELSEYWNRSVIANAGFAYMRKTNCNLQQAMHAVENDPKVKRALLSPKRMVEIMRIGEEVESLDKSVDNGLDDNYSSEPEPVVLSAEDSFIGMHNQEQITNAIKDVLANYAKKNDKFVTFLKYGFGLDNCDQMPLSTAAKKAGLSLADALLEMKRFIETAKNDERIITLHDADN